MNTNFTNKISLSTSYFSNSNKIQAINYLKQFEKYSKKIVINLILFNYK